MFSSRFIRCTYSTFSEACYEIFISQPVGQFILNSTKLFLQTGPSFTDQVLINVESCCSRTWSPGKTKAVKPSTFFEKGHVDTCALKVPSAINSPLQSLAKQLGADTVVPTEGSVRNVFSRITPLRRIWLGTLAKTALNYGSWCYQ